MKAKRLTMDTDYHDLTYIHKGDPSDLEQLFDNMAISGFDATIWDVHWTGTALYHSKRLPVFQNRMRWKHGKALAEELKKFDPLALAIKLGRERNINVLGYFRLLEEAYAPFDGHEFFQKNPQYWWQTRCGMYRMVGWPCYNYPEVREHMLERLDELVEHGVHGVFFDVNRSHIPYFVPYSFTDNSIGFNKPVVDEFKRQYGVDISKFEYIEEEASTEPRKGSGALPFVYKHRWVGTEPFDRWAFCRLLGEGFDIFIREARKRYPDIYIGFTVGWDCGGVRLNEVDKVKPNFRIDLEGLCADKVIDEFILPFNYKQSERPVVEFPTEDWLKGEDFTSRLLPRFQHVIDSGRQLTAWLNDIFSPDGGGNVRPNVADVTAYVDRFLASGIDGAVIHESAFLLETGDPGRMWKELARLKSSK